MSQESILVSSNMIKSPEISTCASLIYASRGINVFPIEVDIKGGWSGLNTGSSKTGISYFGCPKQEMATTDYAKIEAMWREKPAVIGAMTGTSGLAVLQVYGRYGVRSLQIIDLIWNTWHKLPMLQRTVRFSNGNGGEYLFFKHEENLKGCSVRQGSGLAVFSNDQFIVLPSDAETAIRLSQERTLPEAPGWFRGLLVTPGGLVRRSEMERVPNKHRRAHLAEYTISLFMRGFGWSQIEEAVLSENKYKCSTPFSDIYIMQMVRKIAAILSVRLHN